MTTYDKLKEIIIKAVPEINSLNFVSPEKSDTDDNFKKTVDNTIKYRFGCRNITLEDVIITLNSYDKLGLNIDFISTSNVMSVVYSYKNNSGFKWSLNQPLSNQSEETQLAILELIK